MIRMKLCIQLAQSRVIINFRFDTSTLPQLSFHTLSFIYVYTNYNVQTIKEKSSPISYSQLNDQSADTKLIFNTAESHALDIHMHYSTCRSKQLVNQYLDI